MHIEEIKRLIPHRYPFLLVDRVVQIDDEYIKTIKNVSVNEEFFDGHFPGNPIMPGVLQIEALAQSGCIYIAKKIIEDVDKQLVVFSAIRNAKFKKSVVPGDQLHMEINIIGQRRNFITMEGVAAVEGNRVCELEASAAIVKKENA